MEICSSQDQKSTRNQKGSQSSSQDWDTKQKPGWKTRAKSTQDQEISQELARVRIRSGAKCHGGGYQLKQPEMRTGATTTQKGSWEWGWRSQAWIWYLSTLPSLRRPPPTSWNSDSPLTSDTRHQGFLTHKEGIIRRTRSSPCWEVGDNWGLSTCSVVGGQERSTTILLAACSVTRFLFSCSLCLSFKQLLSVGFQFWDIPFFPQCPSRTVYLFSCGWRPGFCFLSHLSSFHFQWLCGFAHHQVSYPLVLPYVQSWSGFPEGSVAYLVHLKTRLLNFCHPYMKSNFINYLIIININ